VEQFFWQLKAVIFVQGIIFVPLYLFFLWFRRQRKDKRNPICRDILRGPGETLRKKIALLEEGLNDLLMVFLVIMFIALSPLITPILKYNKAPDLIDYSLAVFLLAILLPIPLIKLTRKIREIANYQLGLDAELAVGRELNMTMREGFHVFHDFPETHNNIDHVAVGPTGVFAVETKGRAKPDKGRGEVDAKVVYDGAALIFPDNFKETAALAQARRQAASLSKWLSSAVGDQVKARPVLALPGWYVERKKGDDLLLLYGQSDNYARALKGNGKEVLSESMIKRIVHQLEAKCRDVEPIAYGGNKKKQG
jgi:hypothetical protein